MANWKWCCSSVKLIIICTIWRVIRTISGIRWWIIWGGWRIIDINRHYAFYWIISSWRIEKKILLILPLYREDFPPINLRWIMSHIQPWLLITIVVCFNNNLDIDLTNCWKLQSELNVKKVWSVFIVLLISYLIGFNHIALIVVDQTIPIWRLCTRIDRC